MEKISLNDEAFSTKQVAEILGESERKIRYRDEKGLVKPSVGLASGRGSRRLYSYLDLLALRAVKALQDQGVSLQRIQRCVRYLRKNLSDISQPLTFCTLLTDGQSIYLVRDEETLIDTVRHQGQQAFVQLNIAAIEHQLRAQVLTFAKKRVETLEVGEFAYQVEIEPDVEDGGYVAEVAGLPGCITQGETIEDVLDMARDAIAAYLESVAELNTRGVDLKIKRRKKRATG